MSETPELDKRSKVLEDSHKLGFFLDWLGEQGIQLGKYVALLDPPNRYVVVECPHKCDGGCWRVEDTDSISITGLDGHHYESEAEAHGLAADLEDKRLAKAQENPVFQPVYGSKEQLLADYFEIDLDKIETERRALLDALRKAQS
jgi:hypothetical protein